MVKGSKPGEMLGFIEPALATRRDEAPVGEKWVHEVKYDGWRVQAHLNGGEALFSLGAIITGRDSFIELPLMSRGFPLINSSSTEKSLQPIRKECPATVLSSKIEA